MDSIDWSRDTLHQAVSMTRLPAALMTHGPAAQQPGAYPVLIVDDDEAIRDTLTTLLEDAGYAIVAASSGREALATLHAASTPMVVLLDLIMPEPDGRSVLRVVAADHQLARRHAFIIITAASEALLDQTQAEVERFDAKLTLDTVRKPFDIDAVVAAVARIERRLHANCSTRSISPGGEPVCADG